MVIHNSSDLIKVYQDRALQKGLLDINNPDHVKDKKGKGNVLFAFVSFLMAFLGSKCRSAKIIASIACEENIQQQLIEQMSKLQDPRDQKAFLEKMKAPFEHVSGMEAWLNRNIHELQPYIDAIEKYEAALKKAQEMVTYPIWDPAEEHKQAEFMKKVNKVGFNPLSYVAQKWCELWSSKPMSGKGAQKFQQFFFPCDKAKKLSDKAAKDLQNQKNEMADKKGIAKVEWVGHPMALIDIINVGWYSKVAGGEAATKRDAAEETYKLEKSKQAGAAAANLSRGYNDQAQTANNGLQTFLQSRSKLAEQAGKIISQIIINS